MSENKDAQYREEFEDKFSPSHESVKWQRSSGEYEPLDEDMWIGYLAGKKTSQEELSLLKKELGDTKVSNINFMALSNSHSKENESLKKELLVKDTANKFLGLKANEYMRELDLLKKELEDAKGEKLFKIYIDHKKEKAIADADNQKLRQLIEQAKPWVKFPITREDQDLQKQWIKEAELILNGIGL